MKIIAIIQAHMGSTRLPGKVLRDLGGRTMLARVVRRAQRTKLIDEVTVACSTDPEDDAIVSECAKLGIRVHRGSDDDVLDRYHGATEAFQPDAVVRITSDCPLIEPEVSDKVISRFLESGADYVSNTIDRTYPRGLDTEVCKKSCLDQAWAEATEKYQRVHVTPYLYQNANLFRIEQVRGERDLNELRWTVDTPEDYEFVGKIFEHFGGEDDFSWRDVLALLKAKPELEEINRHIRQKALREL
jgi:spore coat polysaccharide biosynthesis protein SpsF